MNYLLQFAVGAGVSWPAVLLGYWVSHRRTSRKIDNATADQTKALTTDLAKVTNAQTVQIRTALGLEPEPPVPLPARTDPDRFA